MESPHLMIFICLAAPLSMMLFLLKGRPRVLLAFLLSGMFMCLLAGEINGLILHETDLSVRFITINISPVVEELLKALPVIPVAFLTDPKKRSLPGLAVAVGVGFATLENTCFLFDASASLPAGLILSRGFGAGMMHGVSTLAVGYSMTVIRNDRKLSVSGTVAALSAAVIYHSIYNIMVQSAYPLTGILLPLVTFIPLLIVLKKTDERP